MLMLITQFFCLLQANGKLYFRVNPGFEEQLCLYEDMQCVVDRSSPLYKQYRLTKLTEKYPGNCTHTFSPLYTLTRMTDKHHWKTCTLEM